VANDADCVEAIDALQADMAAHQRQHVAEVTASANQRLAVETIERLARQNADASPVAAPAESPSDVRHLEVDGRRYTLDKAPDSKPMYRPASQFEHEVIRRAMPRLAMLLTKKDSGPFGSPSWADRTHAAMYFKVKSIEAIHAKQTDLAEYYEQAYQLDLAELLEASNQPFGDWRKDAPTTVSASG
jgi:hypothetical protein